MAAILRKCARDGAADAESGGWQPSWGSIGRGVHDCVDCVAGET
jgi:hypothetical protein